MARTPPQRKKTIKVFVTGDGFCPWCGKLVIAEKPDTHHVHHVDTPGPSKAYFLRSLRK